VGEEDTGRYVRFIPCTDYCNVKRVGDVVYIINRPIRVEYQPVGGTAGLTIGIEYFDETGNKDIVNYPDALLVEVLLVGSSMYKVEFTPDEVGTWTIHLADSAGGTAIKQYVVIKDIENLLTIPAMIA